MSDKSSEPNNDDQLWRQIELVEATLKNVGEGGAQWLKELCQVATQLLHCFREEAIPRHESELADIRENDIALQPRIEQVRKEDRRILASLTDACATIEALDEHAELTTEQADGIKQELDSVLADIRRQREAITKWLSESLLRDRGFSSS